MVGWSANLGSTWSQVEQLVYQQQYPYDTDPEYGIEVNDGYAAFFGVSTVGQTFLAPAGGPYDPIFGNFSGAIPGMTLLTYVPEPGTLALCSLAASTLLLFRRRPN